MEKEKDMKVKNPSNKERFLTWAHLESNQAPTDYESVALTE
jgi:hypothetical protein